MNKNQEMLLKQQIMQLTQQKQFEQAKSLAIKLVKSLPKDVEVWFALAQLQAQTSEVESAVKSYYQVCQRPSPLYAQAIERSVDLCWRFGLHHLGVAPAKELIKLKPASADAHFKLGAFWFQLQHYLEAKPYLIKAYDLVSDNVDLLNYCGQACCYTGEVKRSLNFFKRAQELDPKDHRAYRASLLAANYSNVVSNEKLFEMHRRFGELLADQSEGLKEPVTKPGDSKIRVAYVSGDFKAHSCAYFFDVLAKDYTKERFEVVCYSDVARPDKVTESLKSAVNEWVDCADMDDKQLAERIVEDKIDILVDLVGYAGDGRQGVLVQKPAPVQVSYLGYPNTTGLTQVDYRIADELVDPTGQADQFYTEKLIRLPGGFLCYSEDKTAPEVSAPHVEREGHVCFGSFNAFQKITVDMLRVWSEILKQVPNSTLFLKTRPLADPALREQVFAQLRDFGVDSERVQLSGWAESVSSHLELYDQVDIHLDSYPYHGTTTTFEALWQGVPVVSMVGDTHRARVGLTILERVGLGDLAVSSETDYIEAAVALANDVSRLAALRAGLRSSLAESSLMDRARFIREIESAYEAMLTG